MSLKYKAVPMREQDPKERIKNFDEVPLGYTLEEALEEASRCLQCKNKPCVEGCPVKIDIPAFIEAIRNKDLTKAYRIIYESDSLPAATGRVCPQEEQCQSKCVMGIKGDPVSIGRLERFVADIELEKREKGEGIEIETKPKNNIKVAILGSGPAGLTCAAELAKMGYSPVIFEAFHKAGGVLVYGIPEFRLPKRIVENEINFLKKLGVEFKLNVQVGKAIKINNLLEKEFKAVFISTGAGLPNFMNIEGENLGGIYSANEYLTRVNLMKAYKFPQYDTPIKKGKNVAVIGGGNVAFDAARTALRLGAEKVYIVYRRTEEEMPARIEEIHHGKEEGLIFMTLTTPIRYIGNEKGEVIKMECIKMQLGEKDKDGRRMPVEIPDSNFFIDVDQVIVAIGTTPNPVINRNTPGLKFKKNGTIEVDDNLMTSIPGVFAGGDTVTGAATVITAMGAGRKAAQSIDKYIKSLNIN